MVPLENGKQNVYACGDIIQWEQQKSLAKIPSHISVLVPNLLNAIQGQASTKNYKGFFEVLSIPLGPVRELD